MKKTYIIILVLIVIGVFIFVGRNNKLEAPINLDNMSESEGIGDLPPVSSAMPVPGEVEVEEKIVIKEFNVSGKNFSYSPNMITVKKGDRVKITFENTGGYHDLVVDGYGITTKTDQAPFSDSIEFTADKEGNFEYYCSVGAHRAQGMFGTLKVE